MIYEMNKPSKNMLLSQRELDKMYMEQQNEYFSNNNREDEILKEQGIYNRAVNGELDSFWAKLKNKIGKILNKEK